MRIADYEALDELIRTDQHVISRARRRDGASTVLVKYPRRRPPRLADLELLKHEFELLEKLSVAGVPRPLGLSTAEEGSPLFLDDPGGTPLQPLTRSFSGNLDRFFPVALQVCSILAELHRSDVIHRNVCPRSMLWDGSTGSVTIVDFSSATLGSGGMHHPLGPVLSPLALPYSSPEQTGRMNRQVDHRTDFYSLGVTLCELLTGSTPFESPDQLELIHWHIARAPVPPRERDPRIPETLSQIILKLLSKTPEERYQSAAGVKHDLEMCAEQWAGQRLIEPFALGRRDVTDRFLIPQKLYGREQEVRKLTHVFDQVRRGSTALTLVAGYSGIGKTSLRSGFLSHCCSNRSFRHLKLRIKDLLDGNAQQFRYAPGLGDASSRAVRRFGIENFRDLAQPSVFEMRLKSPQPFRGLLLSLRAVIVDTQVSRNEWTQQPGPYRALVIRAVAL